jgi:hypothetical protein
VWRVNVSPMAAANSWSLAARQDSCPVVFGLGQQVHATALECGDDLFPKGRPFRDRVRLVMYKDRYIGCKRR